MSRIGLKPITVPAGVEVSVADGNVVTAKGPKGTLTKTFHKDMIIKVDGSTVTVKGPKGTLSRTVHSNITVAKDGDTITVTRPNDNKLNRSLHGLTRSLIANTASVTVLRCRVKSSL